MQQQDLACLTEAVRDDGSPLTGPFRDPRLTAGVRCRVIGRLSARKDKAVEAHRPRTIAMSDSPIPLAGSAPQDGDVIVTRESRSAVRYTVRQHPGPVQFSATPRDEAVRIARSFAQKHVVDVWYSENGADRLLEVYRPRVARDAERRPA